MQNMIKVLNLVLIRMGQHVIFYYAPRTESPGGSELAKKSGKIFSVTTRLELVILTVIDGVSSFCYLSYPNVIPLVLLRLLSFSRLLFFLLRLLSLSRLLCFQSPVSPLFSHISSK